MKVKGRVAVVTGGGSGMGQALVVELLRNGCHVAFCDVSQLCIDETLALATPVAQASGTRVTAEIVDVTDRARLDWFAERTAEAHGGKVHLLFANAGIAAEGRLIFKDDDEPVSAEQRAAMDRDWDRCFDVDYFGVLHSVRAFLPLILRQEEGYVLMTSSLNGFITWPRHAAYTSAKFAVAGLAASLLAEAQTSAPHVHVACIHPGGVRTNIVRRGFIDSTKGATNETGTIVERDENDSLVKSFERVATLSSEEAARWILDGVARDHTRILVGSDAVMLDKLVRFSPHGGYAAYRALREFVGIKDLDPRDLQAQLPLVRKASVTQWLRVLWGGGWLWAVFMAPALYVEGIKRATGLGERKVVAGSVALAAFLLLRRRIAKL